METNDPNAFFPVSASKNDDLTIPLSENAHHRVTF